MDPLERKILECFGPAETGDSAGQPRTLAGIGEPQEVNAAAARLVDRGWLRPAGAPGAYIRSEDGRLQLAGPRDVTIYSRPGCHLCEEAKAQIAPLLREFGARLTEINIDEDPALHARYDWDVPVIFVGAHKAAKHRVDLTQFRRQLRDVSHS